MENSIIVSQFIYSWPWYIVRASGLISALVLSILLISGIGLITGFTFRFFAPIKAWAIHKAIGLTLAISVICHIIFLLFDKYANYSISMILLPSLGSPWLGMGVLAFYFLIILLITSLTIIHSNKKLWKSIHLLAYITITFIFFHALNMGTDLKSGFLRYAWILFGIIILIFALDRYRRSFTVNKITKQ